MPSLDFWDSNNSWGCGRAGRGHRKQCSKALSKSDDKGLSKMWQTADRRLVSAAVVVVVVVAAVVIVTFVIQIFIFSRAPRFPFTHAHANDSV